MSTKEEHFTIPDNGDLAWVKGAELFTRQEVFSLLWTQRAMIGNDLKQYFGKHLTREMLELINHPREPEF